MKSRDSTAPLDRICSLLQLAHQQVVIVSAFVGAKTLDILLNSVPDRVKSTSLYVRWRIDDIASGASDWEVWDVAKRHGATMYACEDLHAKIYISDDKALVGSANATHSGLGSNGNLELLMPTDANHPDVAQTLQTIRENAHKALPIGADIRCHSNIHTQRDDPEIPIWLPEISPSIFLDAFLGRATHTTETLAICRALKLPEDGGSYEDLASALGATTTFRLVHEAFNDRLRSMSMKQLQILLSSQIDQKIEEVSDERMNFLVQWLGRFGKNTHLAPRSDDDKPALSPGKLLGTFEIPA